MNAISKKVLAIGVVAFGLSAGSAHALPFINGSIGLSDGGITMSLLPNSIVNQLTSITLGSAPTTGCQGDFSSSPGVCSAAGPVTPASPMTIPFITGLMTGSFSWTGAGGDVFTFTFGNIANPVTRVANHDLGGGLIQDNMAFTATGTVSDSLGLFSITAASLGFGATGTCNNSTGGVTCDSNTASSSWSGVLNALGRNTNVPEPATLGLLGIALVGLGFSRRRKQS